MESECKLCQENLAGITMTCSKGSICGACSEDILNASMQPIRNSEEVFWTLAEVFFKKGKGENVSFEEVWEKNNEKYNSKLIKLEDLYEKR